MTALKYVIVGIQIVLSIILMVVVLFQHGSQRGLSGSIAGGAETFFGKNKGRTIDAKLKRWTAVVAVLFLISSISLNIVIDKEDEAKAAQQQTEQQQAEQQEAQSGSEQDVQNDDAQQGEQEEEQEVQNEADAEGGDVQNENNEADSNAENETEAE